MYRVPLDAIARMGVWNRCEMNHTYISNVDNSALLGAGDWDEPHVLSHPRFYEATSKALRAVVFPGLA